MAQTQISMRISPLIWLAPLVVLALFATPALGVARALPGIPPAGEVSDPGEIVVRVLDSASGEPIGAAQLRLREVGRSALTDAAGNYRFTDLAPHTYTIGVRRLGFASIEERVEVLAGEEVTVVIHLSASALELSGVVVTGTGRERRANESYRPTTVVADAELRRSLDSSLAGTLAGSPGISQQYNGPASSQPVIRGMQGDRVLVLEDGQRTGDLSTTGADHAVAIDPLTAQRIEVVRGPAGLLYGSNALGGVVNVIREEVPRSIPAGRTGMFSAQGESVNGGIAGGGALSGSLGRYALRGEVSGRWAGDTHTPLGVLPSTEIESIGGALGASRVSSIGYIGGSFRSHTLDYGVPGEFAGELIPGAHPHGVEIRTSRRAGRVEAEHFLGFGPVSSLAFDANLVHYRHDEIEGHAGEREIVGATFDNLSGSANLLVRHEHEMDPIFSEGAFGVALTGRDLRTGGGFTGTRPASAYSLAGFLYEELAIEAVRLQVGARFDWTRITPHDLEPIQTGERSIPVRERTFGSLSASLAALYEPVSGVTLGASFARAFRNPTVEELYSDGPHLADYSYDIGNPELGPEIGYGGDLFLRLSTPRIQGEATLFRNGLRNFIHHAPTAELDPRFQRFPLFEARGTDARFEGAEAALQWEFLPRIVVDGALSYVRASQSDSGEPLPAIPPLNGTLELRYQTARLFLSAAWESARRQDRVPSPFPHPTEPHEVIYPERPTPGHDLLHLGGGLRWTSGERLHTLSLHVDNLTDAVWRSHLSRIKEVAPQPGRNLRLLYRVYF